MLRTSNVLDMPTPPRTAVLDGQANFLRIDRGQVREANTATADSSLCHFASGLESKQFNQQSASRIPPDLAINLIGTYLKWFCEGNTLPSNSKGPLLEQSLCMSILTKQPCIVIDPTTLQQKRICMHPYIREQLSQRAAWSQPKPSKAPFTLELFQALSQYLQSQPDVIGSFLTKQYAVYYWMRLGLFTGSRLLEYAQTCLAAKVRYNTKP
jgi:hypothetical protein